MFDFKQLQVRSARAVEDLQRKELEDQLEAEAYFSGLYKTQVRELQEEAEEARTRCQELEAEKAEVEHRLAAALAVHEQESINRSVQAITTIRDL